MDIAEIRRHPHILEVLLLAIILSMFAAFGYGVGYLLDRNDTANNYVPSASQTNVATKNQPTVSSTTSTTQTNTSSGVTIYFDNYGFDPNEATVPVGTTITFKNISTTGPLKLHEVDWFGRFIDDSPFNIDEIDEGQEKSFTVSSSGVWQYEGNHDPSIRGEIGTGPTLSVQPSMLPNAKINSTTFNFVYDIYGFMPNEITVPIGTTLTLKNVTNDSQPGPSLFGQSLDDVNINPALNIGVLQKQESKSFFLNTKGIWILQNLDQPIEKALSQITVE